MWKYLFYLILLVNFAECDVQKSYRKKRYNISICTLITDENEPLKEWIEYHRLVGVDHFYIYYNGRKKESTKQALKVFLTSGIVTFIPWLESSMISPKTEGHIWALSTQIPAFENAIYVRAARETEWLAILNPNEFLVPPKNDMILDVLQNYKNSAGIYLYSDCYDSSEKGQYKELLIENTEIIEPPALENPNKEVVKMIFKPALCRGFNWAPYKCTFKGDDQAVMVPRNELRINHYAFRGQLYIENIKRTLFVDTKELAARELSDLLKQGYAITDQDQAIFRFIPELRKKLGLL